LPRLLDIGLEKLRTMLLEMADLSEKTVSTSIEAYSDQAKTLDEIFKRSEDLRVLQDEISDLAVELLARFGPVASDLRHIKSYLEISYDLSRLGRYAYDISQVFGIFGDLSHCDTKAVEKSGKQAKKMIRVGIKAFMDKDVDLAKTLRDMDNVVDKVYLDHVKKIAKNPETDLTCSVAATLILRYIERIADHATYIGESVLYIMTGKRARRP
jgi:phosphate transport system protein